MKALRKLAAGDPTLVLCDVDAPKPSPGWVLLDVTYAGICGTDLHITHDQFPSWPPVTLGHEFTGVVAATGEGVDGWTPGERVVCEPHSLACHTCHLCRRGLAHLCPRKRSPGWGIDGGFAEQVVVPAHLLHRVPDSVDDIAAGMAEPLAIVVTALERTPVEPGSTVLVLGPGPIGILAALTAQASGAGRVVLVGRSSSGARLALARQLGVEAWDTSEVAVPESAAELTRGRGVDLVIESSGAPAAVHQGLTVLRRRGRMCVLGVSGEATIPVPWGLAMNRAADVAFSLSSSSASWAGALALLERDAVDPRPLATVFTLSDWQQALTATQERTVVKALLRTNHATTPKEPS